MSSPSVFDHLQPTTDTYQQGIYRVVGVHDDRVTLLRVGSPDGGRLVTGEVVQVPRADLDEFESAPEPTPDRSPATLVSGLASHLYWSVRAFVQQLLASPVPAAVGVGLVLAGALGEGYLPLGDEALGLLIVVGSLGLAFVGSGRL